MPTCLEGVMVSMTWEQRENREHRVAYMIDRDVTEEQAHAWCDQFPDEYGTRTQKAPSTD